MENRSMHTEPQVSPETSSLGEAIFRQMVPARQERRAVPRYAVELDVSVSSEHNFYDGLVRDMGVAGVFIATHTWHQVGELIELSINLPGENQPVKALGQVRWTRQQTIGGADPGIGVKFVALSREALDRISGFLRTREPMLYDD
jgi:uncharacterized protein (TIGR02266 family)